MTKYGNKGDPRREKNDLRRFPRAAPGEKCVYEKCDRPRKDAEWVLLGLNFHLSCYRKAADPGVQYRKSYTGGRDE